MLNEQFQLKLSQRKKIIKGYEERFFKYFFELYLPENVLEKYEKDLCDFKKYPHCVHEFIVTLAVNNLNKKFQAPIFLEPPKIFRRREEKNYKFRIYSKLKKNEIKEGLKREIKELLNRDLNELLEDYDRLYEED